MNIILVNTRNQYGEADTFLSILPIVLVEGKPPPSTKGMIHMCYPKPAPRCSTHAKAALVKAVTNYKSNPDNEVSRAKVNEARKEYYGSPAGIEHLRNKAEAAEDQETADAYRKDADHYEHTRKEALAKYNRVKDLPAERREWDYDDDGYADEDDHDHSSEALRNVHDGAGEDYLLKNNLTDIYGWASEDAEGKSRPEIWLDPSEGSSSDEIGSFEVREVELYNVKEGMEEERREVYRLDDGDGYYSTFGSYEEAAAELNDNVGEVITEEEAEYRTKYSEDGYGVMRDEDGYDEEGYDHDGYTATKYHHNKEDEEPRDRLGFNKEGFVAYPHSRIKAAPRRDDIYERYETVQIDANGRNEDSFKVASFDAKSAKEEVMEEGSVSSPMDHFDFFSNNDDNIEHLKTRNWRDASLPFHHKDTKTFFAPGMEGEDYWGRTQAQAELAYQEVVGDD